MRELKQVPGFLKGVGALGLEELRREWRRNSKFLIQAIKDR